MMKRADSHAGPGLDTMSGNAHSYDSMHMLVDEEDL